MLYNAGIRPRLSIRSLLASFQLSALNLAPLAFHCEKLDVGVEVSNVNHEQGTFTVYDMLNFYGSLTRTPNLGTVRIDLSNMEFGDLATDPFVFRLIRLLRDIPAEAVRVELYIPPEDVEEGRESRERRAQCVRHIAKRAGCVVEEVRDKRRRYHIRFQHNGWVMSFPDD